jgi:hypothetical protein
MVATLSTASVSAGCVRYPLTAHIDRYHRSLAEWLGEEGIPCFGRRPRDILLDARLKD